MSDDRATPRSLYRRRLYARQQAAGLDCVALVPGPNLRYVSGLPLFMSERPIVALYLLDERPALLLPELERSRAAEMTAGAVDPEVHSRQLLPHLCARRSALISRREPEHQDVLASHGVEAEPGTNIDPVPRERDPQQEILAGL